MTFAAQRWLRGRADDSTGSRLPIDYGPVLEALNVSVVVENAHRQNPSFSLRVGATRKYKQVAQMKTQPQIEVQADETETGTGAAEIGGKYLTFNLGEEIYGVQVLKVREIIGVIRITAVPKMAADMKGVINLRGKVIAVIDLRLRFGLQEIEHTEQTCFIVVDVGREIGIIVDTVCEVVDIHCEDIEPPPLLGGGLDTSLILGMGKVGESVKILLDIDRVLADLTDASSEAGEAEPAGDVVAAS